MDESDIDINKNTRMLLARNTPVALVVGAASFFGSHLVDKLLLKGIQVIGVDDLRAGSRENLSEAIQDKNFHLVIAPAEGLSLELDRLDYIFIIPQEKLNVEKILAHFKNLKSRLLLISSIRLYDEEATEEDLKELKTLEVEIAKVAKEDNLNARILRLGPIFGPRMSFEAEKSQADPVVKLLQQSLTGDLQKETYLDFSSRALYVTDAVDLAIKCIFAGATAQKIFDGVLPTPIKVSEIKQVLLDPIWYENKNFTPSELPPWPTPNLEKTIKFLNWQPKAKLVESLKQTINYFKEENKIPRFGGGEERVVKKEEDEKGDHNWQIEKKEDLKGLKGEEKSPPEETKGRPKLKFSFPIKKLVAPTVAIFVIYALIWPLVQLGWGVLTFRYQLLQAVNNLREGEFDKSLSSINQARAGVMQAKSIFYSLEPLRNLGFLKSQFTLGDNLASLATYSTDGAENTILGIQSLMTSLKSISGELDESPEAYFTLATTYLASADEDLSKAQALISNEDFKANVPQILKFRVESLSERLSLYSDLAKQGRALAVLLPELVALEGQKDYLVLQQNNSELRPGGGLIETLAKVSFEGGKLKKMEVNDTDAIDRLLKIHVEPPKEIKNDLGQKDYFLKDSNWESDFPTAARQAAWFYNKETGEMVAGVIALDISAIEDLLSVVGPLNLPQYNETITSEDLFGKVISHAEANPTPNLAKKSFLTDLTATLFNKLFFLPNQNWPEIMTSLGRSLESKHMSIYLNDPALFSYIIAQNWAALMPRPTEIKEGLVSDFLAPVEANLGSNKANYYLDRKYDLETVVEKDGRISHRLRIAYTNRSPSNTPPAGEYKNRMRVYLGVGSQLTRVLWGETDITKEVESFSDYGRTGYSFLVELQAKEQKTLVLDYSGSAKLDFKDKKALYRLDVIKQAGTIKDPFTWTVTYPLNLKLNSDQAQKIKPQEYSIQTDLSKNITLQLEFSRP